MIEYVMFLIQFVALGVLLFICRKLRLRLAEVEAALVQPQPAELEAGVREMILELRRAAAEISAELGDRSTALEKLVAEADGRLLALAKVDSLVSSEPQVPSIPPPITSVAMEESETTEAGLNERDAPEAASERPDETAAEQAPALTSDGDGAGIERRRQALRLAYQGWNRLQIARQVGMGREEVDLLLGLYAETPSSHYAGEEHVSVIERSDEPGACLAGVERR